MIERSGRNIRVQPYLHVTTKTKIEKLSEEYQLYESDLIRAILCYILVNYETDSLAPLRKIPVSEYKAPSILLPPNMYKIMADESNEKVAQYVTRAIDTFLIEMLGENREDMERFLEAYSVNFGYMN